MELQTMPLRFRVWDKKRKEMHSDLTIEETVELLKRIGKRNTIVSQDTGLEDEDGKSIYTGDIIARLAENAPAVVGYIVGAAGSYIRGEVVADRLDGSGEIIISWACDVEIIGNIWQKTELLEEQ